MKNKNYFLYCAAIAATMFVFTACGNDGILSGETIVPETVAPVVKGHPLAINASIAGGAQTRMSSSEKENGIKLNWETGDKLYMLTSRDGTIWEDTYYMFQASTIDTDASKATFICNNFSFPDGTTKVKLVYTSSIVENKDAFVKTAQSLGEQTGSIADVAKHIYMETAVIDATTEEEVKNLTASLVHANAVMKVKIAKSDIEWGDSNFAPAEITMKLVSTSARLEGTTDNTITIKNVTAWDAEDNIVSNIVVCMTGEIGSSDRWIFSTKDALGNSLTRATVSAKLLAGGKCYNAPVTFVTGDYFPLLRDNMVQFSGDENSFSLNETTNTIITGNFGAAGWNFENANLNLSKYKYMVIKTTAGYGLGADFRLFYYGGFWGGKYSQTYIETSQEVMNLDELIGKQNDNPLDPQEYMNKATITNACFWTFGGEDKKIVIDKIYLSNTEPTDPSGDGDTKVEVPGIDDSDEDAF